MPVEEYFEFSIMSYNYRSPIAYKLLKKLNVLRVTLLGCKANFLINVL